MEDNANEIPEIKIKQINGVEISNLEISKIGMIYDFLVLDRFQEYSSFFRLEKCFGLFFPKEPSNFLPEVFKEICGPKHKYISYGRLILAYIKWKSKSVTNDNFNKFMDSVFNKIIVTQGQNIGEIVEGGRIFSTRNTRGRKIISRFSVITNETKNKINGFHIQYDDCFDTILSPDKTRNNISLEINFRPNGTDIRDRDGISHIGGKYSEDKKYIKFLMFKCRSGKTFYIGDEKEDEGENIKYFLYGTTSCQLKSIRIEVIDEKLMYLEPKFQPSLRINQKIIDFDSIDDNFINNNILNSPLIFEENEMKDMSDEELEKNNFLIIPCINDDAFIDKKDLEEPLSGKDFIEIYKPFIMQQKIETEDLKNKIYEKTLMRKHLLRIYLKKFKVKENISVFRARNNRPKGRIAQDSFLTKIKAFLKDIDTDNKKSNEDKKENKSENDIEKFWNDEEEKDWPKDESIEIPISDAKTEEKKDESKIDLNKEEKEEPIKNEKIALRGKKKKLIKRNNDNVKQDNIESNDKTKKQNDEEIKNDEIIIKEEQKIENKKSKEIKLGLLENDETKVKIRKKIIKEIEPIEEIVVEEKNDIEKDKKENPKANDKKENKNDNEEEDAKSGRCICNIF